jgi:hypothetical protein
MKIFRNKKAPTGRDSIAQGATLGQGNYTAQALKGRYKNLSYLALSGLIHLPESTQGCTLGYNISPRWGFKN